MRAWLVVLALLAGCGGQPAPDPATTAVAAPATYVGTPACAACHAPQHAAWRGSHHDLAMQVASEGTVLGDFRDARLDYHGERTRFFRRGTEYWVSTIGVDGKQADFRVEYTFGVQPLQQYLVAMPGGRYQALTMAWDSRTREEGGQKWFHLQADEVVRHDDPLHWTGPYYNWNSRCAECHTTGFSKGYDASTDTFSTRWQEPNVACEACHGPGSEHIKWASGADSSRADKGLAGAGLAPRGAWVRGPGQQTAQWQPATPGSPPGASRQLDVCGPCHSRRQTIATPEEQARLPGFHEAQILALPTAPLYHADGQIHDEVFEIGSFLQSRMSQRGVVCSNCHDAHSLRLRAPGNAVCAQCHDAAVFDAPSHHHHRPASAGARCVDCHMPPSTYMTVDERRDHSIRIPRPDLSVKFGTPNACTQCHGKEGAAWAAEKTSQWLRAQGRTLRPHFSERLASSDPADWQALAADTAMPAIARAAALEKLSRQPSSQSLMTADLQARDADPLVRRAAIASFQALDPARRLDQLGPLLGERVRSVRMQLAPLLAPAAGLATAEQRPALEALFAGYTAGLRVAGDMAGNQVSLGLYRADRGEVDAAEAAYRTAMRQDRQFMAAYLNLADLYRSAGRETEAHAVLREALAVAPREAAVHHALGLQRVRAQEYDAALEYLRRAHELAPDNAEYGFIYAVALHDTGSAQRALTVLRRLAAAHPADARIAQALRDYQSEAR